MCRPEKKQTKELLRFIKSLNSLEINIIFTFLTVSSSLSVCLSKAVSTEFLRVLLAMASSSAVTEVARALSSATDALSKSLALSADPDTLRPKRPESVKLKFKDSAAST